VGLVRGLGRLVQEGEVSVVGVPEVDIARLVVPDVSEGLDGGNGLVPEPSEAVAHEVERGCTWRIQCGCLLEVLVNERVERVGRLGWR
jgi:hypothetical protein